MIRIHSFGCHKTIDDDDGGVDNDCQSQVRRKRKHDKNFGRGHKKKQIRK